MIRHRPCAGAPLATQHDMLRLCLALALALALLTGCLDDGSGDDTADTSGPIWGVDIANRKLEVGSSTYALASDVAPRAGEPGMPVRATFTTDDNAVLTLTAAGTGSVMITGANVGTAHLIAHYAGETQMNTIEVIAKAP